MNQRRYGTKVRILRGQDIIDAVETKYLIISPFDKEKVQPTSYDISINSLIKYPSKDIYQSSDEERILEDFDELIISPSESHLFLSLEEFSFPLDMFGIVALRSRYSRLFNAAQYMGRIECGWIGHLVLEIFNLSMDRQVKIMKGESLATIEIFQLESPVEEGYSGRYINWPFQEKR